MSASGGFGILVARGLRFGFEFRGLDLRSSWLSLPWL